MAAGIPLSRHVRRAFFLLSALLVSGTAAGRLACAESALTDLRGDESDTTTGQAQPDLNRLIQMGRDFLRRGDSPRAIELFSEAVARDSEDMTALALLTLAYLRHGDLEFAEFYLGQCLQAESRRAADPEIFDVLGDSYEARNRIEDAIASWQEARKLGSDDPALPGKLDRAQKSWAYAHGQQFFGGDRFDVYYDPVLAQSIVESIDEFLERECVRQEDFFLTTLAGHSIVILYAGRRYFHLMDTPDWVGGFYDGRIHVPMEPGSSVGEEVFGLLRHELAHAFLFRISRGKAPAWLQEGLAQFIEGRRIGPAELSGLRVGRVGEPNGLDDLEGVFHQRVDRGEALRAYRLSLSFTQDLASEWGPGSVVCLARDYGEGLAPDEAFRREYGTDRSTVEQRWRRKIASPSSELESHP